MPPESPAERRGSRPVVDYNRCEGKAACAAVCPAAVFDIRLLTAAERGPLSLLGRVRALLHGGSQAWVARPEQCLGCARCVAECPEEAIRLEAVRPPAPASGGPAGSKSPPA